MPRGVLFVHNNFPGQFGALADALTARGMPCVAIGQSHAPGREGVRLVRYGLQRGTTPGILAEAVRAEADLIRARGAFEAARALKAEGWDPEAIVYHPGWGEAAYLWDVFPKARRIAYAEFYYHGRGQDVGFDPEFFPHDQNSVFKAEAKNAVMLMGYVEADVIVAPTAFQAATLPSVLQPRIRVIHEGVDTEAIRPGPAEPFALDDGRTMAPGTPVITHVNNNLEPLRGLHILARALPRLLAEIADAQVLVIGGAGRAYGGDAPDRTWRETCFAGIDYDPARVAFLGRVEHARMLAALRLGAAHVYYTYPFVLSWSLTEAMASGCYIIGSDTAPLHDAIIDGVNGQLLPFFDVEALSGAMIDACRNPGASAALRMAARETAVVKFDRAKGQQAWLALLREQGVRI